MKTIRFADKERRAVTVPWGDLETAYKTTGIPNIAVYMGSRPGRRARCISSARRYRA